MSQRDSEVRMGEEAAKLGASGGSGGSAHPEEMGGGSAGKA